MKDNRSALFGVHLMEEKNQEEAQEAEARGASGLEGFDLINGARAMLPRGLTR